MTPTVSKMERFVLAMTLAGKSSKRVCVANFAKTPLASGTVFLFMISPCGGIADFPCVQLTRADFSSA
ncbi:Uncharacterised protein [Bordetella pertussis]|nr:Uncharacterised protein [Bordetella pertussis]